MSHVWNRHPDVDYSELGILSAYSDKLSIGLTCDPEGDMTDQSFKEECDINTIMQRYQSTGEMPQINKVAPQYMDCTGHDFQTHMDFIVQAQDLFDQLPSALRDRFGNDPAAFLDFTSNEDNLPEMAKLGLLTQDAADRILYPPPTGSFSNDSAGVQTPTPPSPTGSE